MRKFFYILILCSFLLGCSSDNEVAQDPLKNLCQVDDPLADITWLTEEIDRREANPTTFSKYQYITRSTYKGETIVIYLDCCPTCNSTYTVYNCKGEFIGVIGNREEDIPAAVLENDEIIWRASDFECTF